ncbi:Uncharacterized protein APZ42_026756 [Daphnia magna]|uniref:Uncharacterized protein n=1 Tax=Daphnia magna TaxID=35525 RepID=A0A0P6G2Y7_9CRUS|nr:Uncharacterized protein APZ42_026756 [Daphnia magna]
MQKRRENETSVANLPGAGLNLPSLTHNVVDGHICFIAKLLSAPVFLFFYFVNSLSAV